MSTHLQILKTIKGEAACTICRGHCCKRIPGESMPDRWLDDGALNERMILEVLLSETWTIAFWQGDPRYPNAVEFSKVAYLRPVHQSSCTPFDSPYSTGACHFLAPNGCRLDKNDRPEGCIDLQAEITVLVDGSVRDRECSSSDGGFFLKKAATAWIPYSEDLVRIGEAAADTLWSRA